jgi:hypothetical protein
MNELITQGADIKRRIISEINKSNQSVRLAMAWFTDRDIAEALIQAKKRNVLVEIILSSNSQNEVVNAILAKEDIQVHAFETGDDRGIMHHKFCLIDDKISINGSYNYSYNASNNNVENIHISDDSETYRQLNEEFNRLKYNIDHHLSLNTMAQETNSIPSGLSEKKDETTNETTIILMDNFVQRLNDLVFSTTDLNLKEYEDKGFESAKNSNGNVHLYEAERNSIKLEILQLATSDSLGGTRNILIQNITGAYEKMKSDIEVRRNQNLKRSKDNHEIEKRKIQESKERLQNEKRILEIGDNNTGEKGLFHFNQEIQNLSNEKKKLESTFSVSSFWKFDTVLTVGILGMLLIYLSVFFASAFYKILYETDVYDLAAKNGSLDGLTKPKIFDGDAIVKIIDLGGLIMGIISAMFFLIPLLFTNIKYLDGSIKWRNQLFFYTGLIIFDAFVAYVVARNLNIIDHTRDDAIPLKNIQNYLVEPEFWQIILFGSIPLLVVNFLIGFIISKYKNSRPEIIDNQRYTQLTVLDRELNILTVNKESLAGKIKAKEDEIKEKETNLSALETTFHKEEIAINEEHDRGARHAKELYEGMEAKITNGKIFSETIVSNVMAAYKTGFVRFLSCNDNMGQIVNQIESIA